MYTANIKQMVRSAQLFYIKHNTQTFHFNDISNNNETITLYNNNNNKLLYSHISKKHIDSTTVKHK